MKQPPTKTTDREKYALWLDKGPLTRLRDYQEAVGVPVSESIRRAIDAYCRDLEDSEEVTR